MLSALSSPISRADIAELAARESLVLDDEDRIGVLLSANSIDVQACPGSGKTTLVAAKLMLLAQKWQAADRGICVLSHTNVAKAEIVKRLTRAKTIAAGRLLTYPHFIGTIQEFIDRFVALPYLRSIGISEVTVDNEEYVRAARTLLDWDQFTWLRSTLRGFGEYQDGFLRETYRTFVQNDATDINMGTRQPKGWKQPSNFQRARAFVLRLKGYLEERGVFLFRDMYAYAHVAVSSNANLSQILATRFPYLFLDEMQDTQKFQDDLLRQLFPPRTENSIVQRFGDPDQAIFHSMGSEEPNETFNGKAAGEMDFLVHKSHRFDNGIAEKIEGFSYNEVPLESELNDASLLRRRTLCAGERFEHTVLLFDDETRRDVIGQFAQVVLRQFEASYRRSPKFCTKAVGAVGNEINPTKDQLKIGHYWDHYNKDKAAGGFKPNSLIEAVRYCRRNSSVDWAENYKMLLACLLRLLRLTATLDGNGRYFSATSLRARLETEGTWQSLREGIHMMLDDSYALDQDFWDDITRLLSAIFGYAGMPEDAAAYLEFSNYQPRAIAEDEEDHDASVLTAQPGNIVRHGDGFSIELSTIHGVKGETHDATLVLETKNYCFDMGIMIPYLIGESPSDKNPNSLMAANASSRRANRQFMRQLYVAMSRPTHLLCLAVHTNRLSAGHEQLLRQKGWAVLRLASDQQNEAS